MTVKGLRISDSANSVVSVKLYDILEVISDGLSLNWGIIESDVIPKRGEEQFVISIEDEIESSRDCVYISWDDLKIFSKAIQQEIDLTVIGCKDKSSIHFYETDLEMYEGCEVVIEMIDSTHWEVFSKDEDLVLKLAKKFKETIFLDVNFEK